MFEPPDHSPLSIACLAHRLPRRSNYPEVSRTSIGIIAPKRKRATVSKSFPPKKSLDRTNTAQSHLKGSGSSYPELMAFIAM